MTDSSRDRWALVRNLALWGPPIACATWSTLVQPEVVSLVAPLCGPWAGYLFGHRECTFANVAPEWSWCLAVLGAAVIVVRLSVRSEVARRVAAWALVPWAALWTVTAALSVANTLS
jgi:hypothetical protein